LGSLNPPLKEPQNNSQNESWKGLNPLTTQGEPLKNLKKWEIGLISWVIPEPGLGNGPKIKWGNPKSQFKKEINWVPGLNLS